MRSHGTTHIEYFVHLQYSLCSMQTTHETVSISAIFIFTIVYFKCVYSSQCVSFHSSSIASGVAIALWVGDLRRTMSIDMLSSPVKYSLWLLSSSSEQFIKQLFIISTIDSHSQLFFFRLPPLNCGQGFFIKSITDDVCLCSMELKSKRLV